MHTVANSVECDAPCQKAKAGSSLTRNNSLKSYICNYYYSPKQKNRQR